MPGLQAPDFLNLVILQVEPNAHKIMEHRRKYERLRKEREEKRAERDRLRRRAEAQVYE
jgi:suppressor of tumorigenicity protein 13